MVHSASKYKLEHAYSVGSTISGVWNLLESELIGKVMILDGERVNVRKRNFLNDVSREFNKI